MRGRLAQSLMLVAVISCAGVHRANGGPSGTGTALEEADLVLAARGVARGERVDLPPIGIVGKDGTALSELELPITLGDARRAMRIAPWSIRAPDARLEIVDAAGTLAAAPLPPSALWIGSVAGVADSRVVASIADGTLLAIVRVGDSVWTIEPLTEPGAPQRHLVAASEDLIAAALQCGTTDAETAVAATTTAAPAKQPDRSTLCPRELRIAVEMDGAWVRRCDDRRDAAIARAELLLAWTAVELARHANVLLRETVIVVNERSAEPPESDPPVAAGAAYADLWSRWSTRADAPSRDTVLLVSGRTFADRSFGLAWTGGVAGGPAQACAVTGLGSTPALSGQAAIVAHVIAHLVGAAHAKPEGAEQQAPPPATVNDLLAPRWPRAPRPMIGPVAAAQIAALVHGQNAQGNRPLRSPPLAAPRDVTATDGTFCGGVEVRWTPIEPGGPSVRYQVLRGATEDVARAAQIGEVPLPPFVDAEAPRNPPARYWVRAVDGCGESVPIGGDGGFAPSPVTDTTHATATDGVGCAEIIVTWTPVEHAASYQVLRSGVNNVGSATPIGGTKEHRFVDASPPAGGVLWYWVRGVDRCGAAGPTGRGDGGFTGGVPPAPTGVSATDGAACGSVVVTWNAVAGATSYAIWRSATANIAEGSQVATAQASPFEDVSPPADIDLHYWVRATNACGAGPLGGPDRGRAVTNVPRIADMPDAVVPCGQPYQSAAPVLVNADCAVPVEWRLVSGPAGVLMAADGSVSWPAPIAGTHTLVVAARNARGAGQEQWMVQVTPHAPQPAMTALPPYAGRCGEPMALAAPAIANAACAGAIQWSLDATPPGVAVGADGIVRWATPTVGRHTGTLIAANAAGNASIAWQATIAPAAPRVAEIKSAAARAGSPWTGPTAALENAPCAGTVAWALVRSPEGASIAAGGAIAWPAPVAGRHDFTVRAENEAGAGERTFTLAVAELAVPTIAPIADVTTACGQPWRSEPPTLSNADAAGAVRWALAKAPSGATIDDRGVVALPAAALGEHLVTVTATNSAGTGERSYALRVGAMAPTVESIAAVQSVAAAAFIGPAPKLSNGACTGPVAWKLVAAPPGAAMDADGTVRWDQPVAGVHTITVAATNAQGTGEATWTLTIVAPPPAPPPPP